VLQLQLSQLNRLAAPGAESLIEECRQIIEELHEQIRAMNSG
jgi:hypothetical protein